MKRHAISLALAAAVLMAALASCGPESAPASTGPAELEAHWEVLETSAPNIANRRYEGYTDALIPAGGYGELVPYIGGEVMPAGPFTTYLYGLATHEGEIVTDPVYFSVESCRWYDGAGERGSADALILSSGEAIEGADGSSFEIRRGLCAADGSWYTGQRFSDVPLQSRCGALCLEPDGAVAMLGWDGAELWRWEAGAAPLEGFAERAEYLSYAEYAGDYLIYDAGGEGAPSYIDLRDGRVYAEKPAELTWPPAEEPLPFGAEKYAGGLYTIEDGLITIEPDSGGSYTFAVPEGPGEFYPSINGDRVIFHFYGEASVLTDLDGNELKRWEDSLTDFISQLNPFTPALIARNEVDPGEDGETPRIIYKVYDRDGNAVADNCSFAWQFLDRLYLIEDDCYRLTDLEGRDLIRLSRWMTADIPAEE